jgi:hypothetical protein
MKIETILCLCGTIFIRGPFFLTERFIVLHSVLFF